MTYLIVQMWWCLLFALAGGVAAGWLWRGRRADDPRVAALRKELAAAQALVDVKESEAVAAVESAILAGELLEAREAELREAKSEHHPQKYGATRRAAS